MTAMTGRAAATSGRLAEQPSPAADRQGNGRIRVAVAGTGIGSAHLEAFHDLPDLYEIAAICDLDAPRARSVAEKYGAPRVTDSFTELCRMDGVDVIDICTPPQLHPSQILQALEAGKHAICEKPVAGSLAVLDALASAERGSGRRVMPIFNYRFGHGVQQLRGLVAQGVTGRAYLATIEVAWRRGPSYYANAWRGRWATELGGALTTQAIHFLDQLLYVLGPVRSVFARTATLVNQIEVEDCAVLGFEMANGALASLAVTLGSAVEISRQRYCFANLTAESNLEPYALNTAEPWHFTAVNAEIGAELAVAGAAVRAEPEGFAGQFARFAKALRTGDELPVTLADARATIELLTASYQSARTHAPVELPLGSDHPLYAGWQPLRAAWLP